MVNFDMKKNYPYKIFLFLSTLTRGLVEIFSLVLLYKKGFSQNEIFLFLFLNYTIGIFVNYISLKLPYKITLMISSLFFGTSFLYLSTMQTTIESLIILALLLSISTYSYHSIRHLISLVNVKEKTISTNHIITTMYISIILSSIIGIYLIDKLPFEITSIIIFILSFLSLLPILKLEPNIPVISNKKNKVHLKRKKIIFNILEQFKVMFLEIQPLFLYLYVEQSVSYVGIFNIILNLASLIVVCFIAKKIKTPYFKYICLTLGIIFILKLNIKSRIFLFGIAFFEGIYVKIYENFSLSNLYDLEEFEVIPYLLKEESIFFITKSLFLLIVCLFHLNIHILMYTAIFCIMISGFFLPNNIK